MNNQKVTDRYRKSEADFSRTSPLSFPVVVSSVLHLFKESVEFNLQKILPELKTEVVTGSAFTQARYKIRADFFKELAKTTVLAYDDWDLRLWKGHRLIAGDGSTLNLPITKDTLNHFGLYSQGEKGRRTCLARVFFLYDLLNDIIVHSELSTMKTGEKALLMKGLPQINDHNDIYILDRGFGHFCTLVELMQNQKKFCVRIQRETNFAKSIMKKKSNDQIFDWTPSKKEIENASKNKLSYKPIKIRIVKVKLPSGEIELLATNLLNQNKYNTHDVGMLYRYRWGVEEGFKKLKPKMKIEQFGCRKSEGIIQEFYAHIFCFNMISLAGSIANQMIDQNTRHRKTKYKFNWQNAYRFFREKILRLIALRERIETVIDDLINQITASITAIRPGRRFIRDMRHKNKQRRLTQLFK
ncbi:MAG: IS4 family transposase [Nitrososphaerales archaeon]